MAGSNNLYGLILEDSPTEVIALADGRKRFRKQLVKFGQWVDPQNRKLKMNLDRSWGEKVLANFKNKVVGRIPVPLGHPTNPADLALLNKGELVDVELEDDGVYGVLDIRDPNAAKAIEEDLLWDVSIKFDAEYVDKLSGKNVGPSLLHVGLLTDPYLKGMQPFQALANQSNTVMLSESKESEMAQVKNVQKFAVKVHYKEDGEDKEVTLEPDQEVEVPQEADEEVRGQIADAQAPAEEPTPAPEPTPPAPEPSPQPTPEPTPPPALSDRAAELEAENEKLKADLAQRDTEAAYNTLLTDGRIVPAQRDVFFQLSTVGSQTISLTDGSTKSFTDLLTELIKAGPKRVSFGEQGDSGDEPKTPWDDLSPEEQEASKLIGVGAEQYNEVNKAEATK